jgi:exodeoxyribonuclease VII small subunit
MNAEPTDDNVSHDDDAVGELSYMAASRELDGIVEFFEKSEVDVDQLVARLERATAIVDELDKRIRRTRAQVEELVPRLEAAGRSTTTSEATGDEVGDGGGDDDLIDPPPTGHAQGGRTDGDTLPF